MIFECPPGELLHLLERSRLRRGSVRHAGPDDLPHERQGQGTVWLEPDRALAGLVALELVLELFHDPSRIERAVMRAGAHPDEDLAIMTEGRHLVADALLQSWDGRVDRLAQLLERGALVRLDRSQIVVDGFRLRSCSAPGSRFRSHDDPPHAPMSSV